MSHSKRNTSLAFFTAHERAELRGTWGSKSTRLTRDSFLPFGSCQLCLLPARSPVACPDHGHLFCRECAMSNLLAQNQELKRLRKQAERRKQEDEEERELEDSEARARDLLEFERVQAGLGKRSGNGALRGEGESRGIKRTRYEDGEKSSELGSEKRADAKRRATKGGDEVGESSFWVPSRIPDSQKAEIAIAKNTPICPAADTNNPHPFSLKTLVTIEFTLENAKDQAGDTTETRVCPSCNKALSNASKAILAKPCGHVVCKACHEKFQKPKPRSAHDASGSDDGITIRCYVCQEDITPGRSIDNSESRSTSEQTKRKGKVSRLERGTVELSSEGTGFAGGGRNLVRKEGLAFQC